MPISNEPSSSRIDRHCEHSGFWPDAQEFKKCDEKSASVFLGVRLLREALEMLKSPRIRPRALHGGYGRNPAEKNNDKLLRAHEPMCTAITTGQSPKEVNVLEKDVYLTEREAMELLRLSRSTFYKLRKAGLPHLQIGGAIRYELASIQKWLKETAEKNNEPLSSNNFGGNHDE